MKLNFSYNQRFFAFFLLTFLACDSGKKNTNEPFGNCQYGAPKSIFNPQIQKISQHQFELKKQSAVEIVTFENGVLLELIQSGCEKPKQEFQFTIPSNTKDFKDEDWLNSSLDLLGFLGNLAPELQPFLMWENALTNNLPNLKLGMPHELEQGFFVKIDKVSGENSGLLLVTLYQE